MVMRLLAKNERTPLGAVKDYLTRKLQEDSNIIESHEVEMKQYQDESQKLKEEIREIKTSAKTFQGTKCSICGKALDLPTAHFLCMHSFHIRCLPSLPDIDFDSVEPERQVAECPLCAPDFRRVNDIKEDVQSTHSETFVKLVHKDGFSAIANYFGRGVMSAPPRKEFDDYKFRH
eukprot:TRINITY_DN11815_c0_g1_i1.p1 TRINITY_DN11815_c0_g1~~TRINITY_DN11815_c0_g1_i1.p1  ORF type:complete len:175 (+),score=46.90 TRINITY_DN11815_c0_g1_i1:379-903(+)